MSASASPTCWWSASKAARIGVSLSFVDSDSHGRRVPSRIASPDERADITEALARARRGILQHVPRFMRTEGYLKDLDKIDLTCRPHGITQTFAPLPAQRRTQETTDAVMDRTRALRAQGASVWPQVSPRAGLDSRVVFDSALLFAGMPAWAEMSQARPRATDEPAHRPDVARRRAKTGRARPSPCSRSRRSRRCW